MLSRGSVSTRGGGTVAPCALLAPDNDPFAVPINAAAFRVGSGTLWTASQHCGQRDAKVDPRPQERVFGDQGHGTLWREFRRSRS